MRFESIISVFIPESTPLRVPVTYKYDALVYLSHNFFSIHFAHYHISSAQRALEHNIARLQSHISVPDFNMSSDPKGSDKGSGSNTTVKEGAGSQGPVFF
jgi:hypothetical protein